MTRTHTAAVGPTAAELRMLSAYDTFSRLLESKPAEAQKLAYEVATVAEKYQFKQTKGTKR